MTYTPIFLQDDAKKFFGPLAYVEQTIDVTYVYTECWGIEFEKLLRIHELGFEIRNIYKDGDTLLLEIAR